VAGLGVFAEEPVAAGTVVARIDDGRVVTRAEYEAIDWDRYTGRIMQIDRDLFLEGIGGVEDFINHGCDPNLGFDETGRAFVALRPIAAGEEVLYHYSTSEDHKDWRVPCRCGLPGCRGVLTGFRDLSPEGKERLRPISLPYLREG